MIKKIIVVSVTVSFFLLLSLFRHWEPSETWGYWTFSRILWETGEFIIPDRSPAYVTYLLLFRWLPFPVSIATEYFVTTGIAVAALILFFRPLLGLGMATFAGILWIPFLQIAEPPPQKLALALSLFAVMLRNKRPSPFRISSSYALLILCYLLRSTYQFFLLVFLIWDGIQVIRFLRHRERPEGAWRSRRKSTDPTGLLRLRPRNDGVTLWPLIVVLGFYLLVLLRQSPHPWNTIYFSTAQWFSHDGKHFSIHQIYNARYAHETYGTVRDKDFYFTNQEVFHGARSNLEAVLANPAFVLRTLTVHFTEGIDEMMRLTLGYVAFAGIPSAYVVYVRAVSSVFLGAIFYGAFRGASTSSVRLLVIGSILLAFLSMVILPLWRYMPPLIPVFLLAVVWYAKKLGGQAHTVLARCFTASLIIALCSGIVLWKDIVVDGIQDSIHADLHLLRASPEKDYGSLTAALPELQTLVRSCREIVLVEKPFLAAFTDISISNIHDVFSLPPFGRYDNSDVSLLNPERVNCLFISRQASQDIGYGTNIHMRYERYLVPYKEALLQRGAQVIPVESLGEFVIAP